MTKNNEITTLEKGRLKMGEANRRGTFEERKAAAIKRNKESRIKKENKKKAIEAAKTPEQRAKEREDKIKAGIAMSRLATLAAPYMFYKNPYRR